MNLTALPPQSLTPPLQAVRSCRTARHLAIWSVVLSAFGQLLIGTSSVNTISVFIVAIISVITFHFLIRGHVFRAVPLSALVVLGFNVSAMSGALIVQTVSWRPLDYNLQVPLITFTLCAIFQITLLCTLYIFLSSTPLRATSQTINRRVFQRLGVMKPPTVLQIWIMGLIGSIALLGSDGSEFGDVGGKFIEGLFYLAFAPFIIPVIEKVYPSANGITRSKAQNWLLLLYFILIVYISLVRNTRGILVMGIANLGMIAILLILMGQLKVTARLKRGLMMGAAAVLIIAPTAADLAIAMVVVRGERANVSSSELVTLTIEALNDKPTLEAYRERGKAIASIGAYEENYLANPFLARLINTKFFDNSLSYENVRLGERADIIWSITIDKTLAFLPTPALNFLGLDIDKSNLAFSMGDALLNAQTGEGLGGYKVGSTIGHGMALMGPAFFIATIPLFLVIFMALQSLSISTRTVVFISPLILLQLMTISFMSTGDSLLNTVGMIIRTLPQNILIYWLIYKISYLISIFLSGRTTPLIKKIPNT